MWLCSTECCTWWSPRNPGGTRLPIDSFFRSLAADQGERAICIVLSGTGSDGTLGVAAMKGAGGMTMAQAEEQAKHPFMPRSAIDTGMVDHILPVEKMPEELLRYMRHPYLKAPPKPVSEEKKFLTVLQKILLLVRSATKHDFTHYKPTTIRRRIERRLAVHKIEDIANYYRYLTENPGEVQMLFKDLVICVTCFFRDPAAFKALETKVIPDILAHKPKDGPVRVWVPGAATGEEALSIAMLLVEGMEKLGKYRQVQIFATDIDADVVERARQGDYPESIAADVPPDRLKRFFIRKDSAYRIKQEMREMVIYAEQNVISDPAFSRLDLISCRNLLIYLDMDLQKQIIPMFHYCLNPGGYLFLGASETIGGFSDMFQPLDLKWKIYQRKGLVAHRPVEYPPLTAHRAYEAIMPVEKPGEPVVTIREYMEKVILTDYSPSAILLDNKYDIQYFQGDTGRYLAPPRGEPSFNLLKMAREDLRPRLLSLLHQASREKRKVELQGLTFKRDGASVVDVIVRPLAGHGLPPNLFLMIFEDKTPAQLLKKRKGRQLNPEEATRFSEMENELQATRQYLQTTSEELEASNEELKSTNEELQSTNEELETAKEELQSTNEELLTVNSELQGKVEELSRVNDDINNLLGATEVGTIFLDTELRVQRFTPPATRLFNLIPTDVGRSLRHITAKIAYPRLYEEAAEVLHSLQQKEMDVQGEDGGWFTFRVLPYRTVENVINGVVITFVDISEKRVASISKVFAEGLLDTVREPLLILDETLKLVAANNSFYRDFLVVKEETLDRPLYDLGGGEWNIPALRRLLEDIIPQDTAFKDFEVDHEFPRIGRKTMVLNARKIRPTAESPELILLAIEDVIEGKKFEKELLETISDLKKQVAELTALKSQLSVASGQ